MRPLALIIALTLCAPTAMAGVLSTTSPPKRESFKGLTSTEKEWTSGPELEQNRKSVV